MAERCHCQTSAQASQLNYSHKPMRVFICACHNNMADSSAAWKEDEKLKESMVKLVQQGLQRIEALDFLKGDFPEYPWSMRTLDRRTHYKQQCHLDPCHHDVFKRTHA